MKAVAAVLAMLLVKSDVNLLTETIVAVTVVAIAVAEAATVVTAVVIVVAEVTIAVTAVVIGVRGASDVTSMATVDLVRIAQSVLAEMTKAAEIVARGAQPVVMMVAVDDRVRLADARLSK